MIIKCSYCGKKIERTKKVDNAICYSCKMKSIRENHKNKVGVHLPENYNISWEEMRERLVKIRKDNLIKKINK